MRDLPRMALAMGIAYHFHSFVADERGAVTIDWVVLTAATVGMGMAVMAQVSAGVENLARVIEGQLSGVQIRTSFEEWDAFREQQAAAAAVAAAASDDE